MKSLLYAAVMLAVAFPVMADPKSDGTITIPYEEYERLKKAVEAEKDQWWNMTFQQILEKKRGDEDKAWALYEYYVLRTVYLGTSVTGGSVGNIIEDFSVLNEINDEPITLVISSPGGSVFDGLKLYNAMMASKSPIHTVCDGMAASMAAVLLSAGDHRTARDACIFMIHEVAGGGGRGQTSDHMKTTDWFISIENVLLEILSENSGLSMEDVRTLGEFETFWNAREAHALGFVDMVPGEKPRELAAGSRTIPDELLPKARMARHLTERMAE